MNKMKTAALLLSLLIIAALSILPRAVAVISDIRATEKPDSAPMQSVELDFDSEKAENTGYMMRKLALEQRMNDIPIESEQASMTSEEVVNAAVAGMEAYTQVDLFEWFDYTYCSTEAYLAVDAEQKTNISVIWGVTFCNENDPYNYLFLHIDDETGKIVYINYATADKEPYLALDREKQVKMIEGFADAFFRPLNLMMDAELEVSMTDRNILDNGIDAKYTFVDAEYGTICVELHIRPERFWVSYL